MVVKLSHRDALDAMLVNMDMQDWENLTPLTVYEVRSQFLGVRVLTERT